MSIEELESGDPEQPLDEALSRSALYGALSMALHHPTQATLEQLRSETARQVFQEAAAALNTVKGEEELAPRDPCEPPGLIDLAASMDYWGATFPRLTLDQLTSLHGRLFGHTARSLVCPYETEYGPEGLFQQPRQLADILGFYQAFGLTLRPEERERADHVSCELEFMDFLSRKEAFARTSGDASMLEETQKATRLFLKHYLGRFGRAFARRLQDEDPDGFFGRLGSLLFDFITRECRRLGIQPGAPMLRLRPEEEDGAPMACGGNSDLVQLQ